MLDLTLDVTTPACIKEELKRVNTKTKHGRIAMRYEWKLKEGGEGKLIRSISKRDRRAQEFWVGRKKRRSREKGVRESGCK